MNIFDILIIQPIFNLLIGLYGLIPGGDFGVSLIIFTVIVRLLLYPLVKKQLHQTRAMKKLQPELARIKRETKGDKQQESMRMLELYKQHGVSPFRSILILLIQLPIFIALFQVISIFTSKRGEIAQFTYDALESVRPIRELIDRPEHFNERIFGIVDLARPALSNNQINLSVLLLAITAAVTQYVMSRQLTPKNTSSKSFREIMKEAAGGQAADQSEMNALISGKMMKLFPFIMLFVMVNLPGALVLYYVVSNIVAIGQQAYVLGKDEQELEELAEKRPQPSQPVAEKQAKTKGVPRVTRITAKDNRKRKKQ